MINADWVSRFWAKDSTLWGEDRAEAIAPWLGWIDVFQTMKSRVGEINDFVEQIINEEFTSVVVAGMGGSSLAPFVVARCIAESPRLKMHMLDLTNPATILELDGKIRGERTLFIVASKSGTTAEPNAFEAYYWEQEPSGDHFVAITDPDNPFHARAEERGYRKVFLNFPDIGGRFSALSYFGLVPTALQDLDLNLVLAEAQKVFEANQGDNAPAFMLGQKIAEAAQRGSDKLTLITPPDLVPLGWWMEQLVAESTGKEGKGVLPVAGEAMLPMSQYGADRFFVVFARAEDEAEKSFAESALAAGHPVHVVHLESRLQIFGEFLAWEIATAVIGATLGINPFDQPNVQESKDITRRLLNEVEAHGALPQEKADGYDGPLTLFGIEGGEPVSTALSMFFAEEHGGDFIALMAFLPEQEEIVAQLVKLQSLISAKRYCATTLGFGPRFLHSTGQYHKGGPNRGRFIQFTADHPEDVAVPGQAASWGQFVDAQAQGDLEALRMKDRKTLRIHLGADAVAGLDYFCAAVAAWLD